LPVALFTASDLPKEQHVSLVGGTNASLAAEALQNVGWVLQSSTDMLNWMDVTTNYSGANQILQIGAPVNETTVPRQFYRLRST
jgi:hypothetical protein